MQGNGDQPAGLKGETQDCAVQRSEMNSTLSKYMYTL